MSRAASQINGDDKLIPLDKSWVIRMSIQELLYGDRMRAIRQLDAQTDLSDDIKALREILGQWSTSQALNVGESGTLLRFFTFINWKQKLGKEIIMRGTLLHRPINDNPSVIEWSQERLLTLDNGTSQWASAAVLCGDQRRLKEPPFKLNTTYEAWHSWHASSSPELLRRDKTIEAQAHAFRLLQQTGELHFIPKQAEDFPFAYMFGCMGVKQGEQLWPSLIGHESNRITEVVEMKRRAEMGKPVTSRDHRVVQALAMWSRFHKKRVTFTYPEAVTKSWPRFWDWLDA